MGSSAITTGIIIGASPLIVVIVSPFIGPTVSALCSHDTRISA